MIKIVINEKEGFSDQSPPVFYGIRCFSYVLKGSKECRSFFLISIYLATCINLTIDLLAILQKSLDRALFLYNFIREVRSSGVRGSNTIMHIRKSFKLHHNIVRFGFFPRRAKRSIVDARRGNSNHAHDIVSTHVRVFEDSVLTVKLFVSQHCLSYKFIP